MIKWIFSDIDGTILPYDQPFSQRTIETIGTCPVPFSLISGRMPVAMMPIINQLGLSGIHAGNNGAVIFRVDHGKSIPLKTFPLLSTVVQQVIEMLKDQFPEINYCWYGLNEWFASGWDKNVQIEADYSGISPVVKQKPKAGKPVLAMLIIEPDQTIRQRFLSAVNKLALPDLQIFYTGGGFIEMTSREAGKSSAIDYVCTKYCRQPAELAAFGDGGNDLAMFKSVGWPVAVGNAAAAIKEAAKVITAPDIDDGVAQMIERWRTRGQLG